jgi:hypothetical protein
MKPRVEFDARLLGLQLGGDRPAPGSHQEIVGVQLGPVGEGEDDLAVLPPRRGGLGAEQDVDALAPQQVGHRRRDIGVLPRQQLRGALHQGHPAAEDGEHRGELTPDVPAAEDEDRRGQPLEVQDALRRPGPRLAQARQIGQRGRGAGVDHHLATPDGPTPAAVERDLDGALGDEAGGAHEEVHAGAGEQPGVGHDHAADHALLVRPQPVEDDGRFAADPDAELVGPAGGQQGSGRRDQRLGGDAGDVDAGATDLVVLHRGDGPAGLRPVQGQRLAGLAATDDQQVDVFDPVHAPPCELLVS